MLFTAGLYLGKECSIPDGCVIKFDPTKLFNTLQSNTQYFLLSGGIYVSYNNEISQLMLSPYNSTWSSYHNPWNYEKFCELKVIPTTVFASVHVTDPTNFSTSVITFENSTVTKSMAPNSAIFIVGSDYMVDDSEYSNQRMRTISASGARDIKISTNKSCSLIYIEPV